jgi:hypothetical protein
MDTLPVELLTIIATDSFELFIALLHVPTIGQRLCGYYPQLIARAKFITTGNTEKGTYTLLNGHIHSICGLPAITWCDGSLFWVKHGKRHRDGDQPAVIFANGSKAWYQNGEIHRDYDQPAINDDNGSLGWYQHGKKHRDGDQPAVILLDGSKGWFNKDVNSRVGAPAIMYANGRIEYYIDGVFIQK